ncbi:hypothetical protein L7F22_042667 [Adiantum nelumboides]|nr:hypothetical protein [Adiantum nelumboides]
MSEIGQGDLLHQFQNWRTSEEEQEEYNNVFLQEYYRKLSSELQQIIRLKVKRYLEFLVPFGGCRMPLRWSFLDPREGSPTPPEYSYWTRSRRRNTQAREAAEEEDTCEDQEEEEIPTPDSLRVLIWQLKWKRMKMVASEVLPPNCRPLHAESINMATEVEEDEEQEFLRINASVIPIFEVDVQNIAEKYVRDPQVKQRSAAFSLQATKTQSFIRSPAFFDAARMQTRTSNRSRRSTSSTGADVHADEEVEILMQSSTSRQQGERVTIEHQFIDFKVDILHSKGFHAQWLQSINLLEYARLPWSRWRHTTEVGMHVSNLVENNGLVGYGVYLSAELVSKVFGLQQGEENHVDRASEQIMDREFGKCEGTRGYYLIKNVANLDRALQIKWFLERFLLLVKLEYVSRENYAIISAAEQGRNFGWANMLYDRLHSEVFCKDKRKTQRSTKIGPLITAIFSYVRNNAILRSLSEGDVQANNLQGAAANIQATVNHPAETPESRKKIREDIKEDDTQERVKGIYDDLLTAGYSHEICMDTLNLKKSELTNLPPSGSKSVKKVLRIKKRKVAEMASDADQEPVGQQLEGIQTANSNFEDIPYARCLESVKLIGDYVGQQKINSNLLINDNEKLKQEVAYLKLEMKNKTVSDEEVNAIKTKLRSTESQLECALKKFFYSEQMHRRESNARIYKEWMMEWDNIFHQQLEVLSTVNVTLEAENKVLLDRVSACKEVEKKIKECAEDELEIEGCFMSGTNVDTMKMELQKHLEPIWTEMKEKLLEVSSRPYKEFAEEENKEEYMLLQTQYTDLQEKYNLLLKKQLEADQSTEDFKVLEDQQEPCEEMEKTPDNKNLNVLFAGIEQTFVEELKSVEDVAEESIQSPKEKTGPDSLIKQDFQPTRLNFGDQVPEEGVSESAVAECDDNKIKIIVNESEVTTQEFLADIAKKTA